DQELGERRQHQNAEAIGGKDYASRGDEALAVPAAQKRDVRHIAEAGGGNADAEAGGELELPERAREGGERKGEAEQAQPQAIDGARARAVEEPADQGP